MCCGIVEGLHLFIDRNGDDPGLTGNIAADHQDDAEFAERMGEGQDGGGEVSAQRQGRSDGQKGVEGRAPRLAAASRGAGPSWVKAACSGCTVKGSE